MKAPKCRTCGKEHWGSICAPDGPAQNPPQAGKGVKGPKSTAARKDVPEATRKSKAGGSSVGIATQRPDRLTSKSAPAPGSGDKALAGTQAPPVDNASSPSGKAPGFGPGTAGSNPAEASKFDKKAWMREYMRGYRARKRDGNVRD